MKAFNSRAVSLIRYGNQFTKWTKYGQEWTKTTTMHESLYPQADSNRLYIPRNSGGRGMISVEDCEEIETGNQMKYVESSNKKLLTAAREEGNLGGGRKEKKAPKARNNNVMERSLHLQFMRKTDEVRSQETWNRLKI